MNYLKKFIFYTMLLTLLHPSQLVGSCNSCSSAPTLLNPTEFEVEGVSFFSPRSQSTNAARDLVGWHPFINQPYNEPYGAVSITPSFGQILRARRAAQVMFGTDYLEISGSQVANRDPNDILADYFGLSTVFESEVQLSPFIRTGLIDFGGYFSWKNFYFIVHAPLVYTRWQLGVNEIVLEDGVGSPFPADYMDATPVTEPVQSWGQAVQGNVTFGQVSQGMKYGKFGCPQSLVGLSDLEMAIGWNLANNNYGHAGFNIRVYAPTGNRPTSEFLFEPMVGNGKHWELGIGFSGHALLWEKDGTQEFSFFSDINIMHSFAASQRRSFDLIMNGFGSRYILLKQFDTDENYTGVCLPAINVTTLDCKVSIDAEFDIVFMFGYTYNEFVMDIGYNGWIRTREIISLDGCIPENTYGFKGIENVTDMFGNLINTTESNATLHGDYLTNQIADADVNSPIFINTCDLDLFSAASPLVITHKLFGHLGYSWPECWPVELTPYLGLGGEIEFEGINERKTVEDYKDTLSQWSIWLKGGFAY